MECRASAQVVSTKDSGITNRQSNTQHSDPLASLVRIDDATQFRLKNCRRNTLRIEGQIEMLVARRSDSPQPGCRSRKTVEAFGPGYGTEGTEGKSSR